MIYIINRIIISIFINILIYEHPLTYQVLFKHNFVLKIFFLKNVKKKPNVFLYDSMYNTIVVLYGLWSKVYCKTLSYCTPVWTPLVSKTKTLFVKMDTVIDNEYSYLLKALKCRVTWGKTKWGALVRLRMKIFYDLLKNFVDFDKIYKKNCWINRSYIWHPGVLSLIKKENKKGSK